MRLVVLTTAALAAGAAGVLVFQRRRVGPTTKNDISDAANREMGGDVVAFSSQVIAASRAAEAEREDPLFVDALAPVLSGGFKRSGGDNSRIAVRTKYFDDWATQAVGEGRRKQVVILGAGMDSRVYRLPFGPDVTVFEVDQAVVVIRKEELLATVNPPPVPRCHLRRVCANVTDPSLIQELEIAGYEPDQPSAWVLEGLTYYLSDVENREMFTRILEGSAPGSTVLASLLGQIRLNPATANRMTLESQFKWACPDPNEFFTDIGFSVDDIVHLGSEKANYGRWNRSSKIQYVTLGNVGRHI